MVTTYKPANEVKDKAQGKALAQIGVTHGFSRTRIFLSVALHVAVLSVLGVQLQRAGIYDILKSYIEARFPSEQSCGHITEREFILLADNIVTHHGLLPGSIYIRGSMIADVSIGGPGAQRHEIAKLGVGEKLFSRLPILDYGNAVLSPGLIDLHTHMNEPGREFWEGAHTATKAAAAGGITTIIDMPLNSEPATTTPEQVQRKIRAIENKTHVNVGLWGGIVPQNVHHPKLLAQMAKLGVLGFKSFLSPSGFDSFENVSIADVKAVLPTIQAMELPYLVHAELVDNGANPPIDANPKKHDTWLNTRPQRFETNAVHGLLDALRSVNDQSALHQEKHHLMRFSWWEDVLTWGAPKRSSSSKHGFKLHIVHLANADLLPVLKQAKEEGLPVSVEVTPHHLTFASEDVPDGDTRFKCAPPLRSRENREGLWNGLKEGTIDAVASDHSPAEPGVKLFESGDFMKAWGGIAGLQYGLPATWHGAQLRNVSVERIMSAWSTFPAQLAGLGSRKGALKAGYDADIVAWDMESLADTSQAGVYHRHKANPYQGAQLKGRVRATFVGGRMVFDSDKGASDDVCGSLLV